MRSVMGTAACYRWLPIGAEGTPARFSVAQASDRRVDALEDRGPPLDHLAKAGVDERLGDERSGDISREARDLGDFAIGKRALPALGSLHDKAPGSRRREAGLSAAVGSPQALGRPRTRPARPRLHRTPSRQGTDGPPRSRRSLPRSTARCTGRNAAHPCGTRRLRRAPGDGSFGPAGFAGWQADAP